MTKLLLCGLMFALPVWAGEAPPTVSPSAYVKLQGAPKSVRSTMAALQKEAAYKAAGCQTTLASKSGNLVGMSCSKPDSALMDTLNRLASHGVKWNMSVQGCAVGCTMMACPPPGGPTTCCKRVSGVYTAC